MRKEHSITERFQASEARFKADYEQLVSKKTKIEDSYKKLADLPAKARNWKELVAECESLIESVRQTICCIHCHQ